VHPVAPQDSQNCRGNFPKRKQSTADLCQITRMVTIEIVINSNRAMGIRVTISGLRGNAFVSSCYRRMPRSGKLPVLYLLTGQKSGFSPHRGDSLHRLRSNLVGPMSTWVRLAVHNFTSTATRGWECGLKKYPKSPLYGKESPRRGDALDRFRIF